MGSSAHIAKLLDLPVILVYDGKAMSKVFPVVLGYQKLDPELHLVGVILTGRKPEHFKLLKMYPPRHRVKSSGYLPQNPGPGYT